MIHRWWMPSRAQVLRRERARHPLLVATAPYDASDEERRAFMKSLQSIGWGSVLLLPRDEWKIERVVTPSPFRSRLRRGAR